MPRLMFLAALLLTLLTLLARPSAAQAITVADGPATIELSAPDAAAPMVPGVAGLLLIHVEAPPEMLTAVTIQTPGLEPPSADSCRRPDTPDPEFAEWWICEARGSWALAMTIPAQSLTVSPLLCEQLYYLPMRVNISVDNRRLGARIVTALYRPCHRVALPLVHR